MNHKGLKSCKSIKKGLGRIKWKGWDILSTPKCWWCLYIVAGWAMRLFSCVPQVLVLILFSLCLLTRRSQALSASANAEELMAQEGVSVIRNPRKTMNLIYSPTKKKCSYDMIYSPLHMRCVYRTHQSYVPVQPIKCPEGMIWAHSMGHCSFREEWRFPVQQAWIKTTLCVMFSRLCFVFYLIYQCSVLLRSSQFYCYCNLMCVAFISYRKYRYTIM